MISIPKQLQDKKFRFIKIISGTKRAQEKDWTMTYNYKFDEKEFKDYLKTADSYGVIGGFGNLAIVDCDEEELAKDVLFKLPKTFTVKTGSGKYHIYYVIPDWAEKIKIINDKDKHFGEVQYSGSQCLGPGSLHPNGNTYEVLYNEDIKQISKEELMNVLKPYLKSDKNDGKFNCITGFDLDITKVAEKIQHLDNVSGGLQGPHPVHGTDNPKGPGNFRIEPEKNIWNCFRCNSGGDALSLIGVLEGIVKCSDCKKGFFKKNPEVFKKILKVAGKKYGYKINTNIPTSELDETLYLFRPKTKTGDLDVQNIVEYIKQQVKFITVKDATGRMPHIYVYQDGYYRLNGEDHLVNFIKKIFNELPWKTHYKNEIMDYIKTENIVERDSINPPKNLINLNNGVYNLDTKKLMPHSPDYYFLYKIPWDYNPKAKCQKIMKYLNDTLKENHIKFTQELFGYCLYYDYNIHGVFYLYGTGGNGKSIWIKLLENMLGLENRATKSISSLIKHRFTSALLYGKLANISGELTASVLKDADMLKQLSAGDAIQAEFKGKDGFDFENKAKIITACNSIPYCQDMTDGWYQRQYIIPFLKKFRDSKNEDTELKDKLITQSEMEGLLSWAIEGLHRLLKNKKFTYNDDKQQYYIMYQQNTRYFIDETYINTGNFNDFILINEIREEYSEWCKKNDIPRDSDSALGRSLTYKKFNEDRMPGKNGYYTYIRRFIKKVGD